MFKAINGWTKAKMLKVIKARRYNAAAVIGEFCAYTTPNGNRCAVGLFIPKGHGGSSICGGVYDLFRAHPELKEVMPLGVSALTKLQKVHDHCSVHINGVEDRNAKEAMIEWVQKNVG